MLHIHRVAPATNCDAPFALRAVQQTHPVAVHQTKAQQEAAPRAYGAAACAEAAAYGAAHEEHAAGAVARVPQDHMQVLVEGSHTHARDNLDFAADTLGAVRVEDMWACRHEGDLALAYAAGLRELAVAVVREEGRRGQQELE